MNTEVYEALEKIEGFNEIMSETLMIERLGGLTNRNYKINCEHGAYVLRLAGEGTSDYIDREAEFQNASIASEAGVNAEIVYFDVDTGTMMCRYIANAVTMDIEDDTGQAPGYVHQTWYRIGTVGPKQDVKTYQYGHKIVNGVTVYYVTSIS